MITKHTLTTSTITPEFIANAVRYTWGDLLNFEHPLMGKMSGGPANCRLDVLPQRFLSVASGSKIDEMTGRRVPNINASMIPMEQLPTLVQWLREACTPRQIKQIRALFGRINNENQLNRTRKRDRRYWLDDINFQKWNKESYWAITMKAFCEQFNISLPPEFEKEWDGGW